MPLLGVRVFKASMKVLSLLLRNGRIGTAATRCRARLNESPELIAQECGFSSGEYLIGMKGLNESPELIAQESQCSSTRPSYTAWPQ